MSKYTYVVSKSRKDGIPTVIAISSYAGRPVRGIAKCRPGDVYDEEKGKQLATARCNLKVAEKRRKRASAKYLEAVAAVDNAVAHLEKMRQYFMDAQDAYDNAGAELSKTIKTF